MKLSDTVNVIDCEHDNGTCIEVGLTTVNLKKREIMKSYSIPIKRVNGYSISKSITELTGWTDKALDRQGFTPEKAIELLTAKHAIETRLCVTDHVNEIPFLLARLKGHTEGTLTGKIHRYGIGSINNRLNVSILFSLLTGQQSNIGLEEMLAYFGHNFEGRQHSAKDDSRNIARVFIEILNCGKFRCS